MIDDQAYIAELESALLDRDAEIERLRQRYEPAKPVPTIGGPFVMPDDGQLHALLSVVSRAYPQLARARGNDGDLFEEFCTAFAYIGSLHRTPNEVDVVHSSEHWITLAREHARRPMTLCGFAAAAVAAGDLDFVAPHAGRTDWYFGLMIGQRQGSRPASNGWLAVLQGKPLRTPIRLEPVRWYGEGGRVSARQ